MNCPVDKSPLIVIEWSQIEVDHCNKCKGVWFDAGEIDLLIKKAKLESPAVDFLKLPDVENPHEKNHKCPVCGRIMKKRMVGNPPDLCLDVCDRGHGIWFDGGELKHFLTELSHEHRSEVTDFLSDVFKTLG